MLAIVVGALVAGVPFLAGVLSAYLRSLGLRVDRRPNGRPLVARAEWDRAFGQQRSDAAPGVPSAPANGPRWLKAGVA